MTDVDPGALISQLGSKQESARAAAATSLERIGPEVLPALRAALNGRDAETTKRLALVIRRIEEARLTRPTMVTLDFRDRPMSEVIRDVTARTGCRLRIYELQTAWLAHRITLRDPVPVPFWKAVDRICDAGQFQYNLGSDGDGASVSLFRGEISGPSSDFGVFRVQIEEIYYKGRYRQLHLGQDHASRPIFRDEDRQNSYVELRIMVEPRMMIREDGPLTHLSAIDDRGQSLVATDPVSKPLGFQTGYTPAAYALGKVPLKPVDQPGRTIRKLKGIAPVAVGARRLDPLVIPLAGAVGRPYRTEESVVTVRKVAKMVPESAITIEVVEPDGKIGQPNPDYSCPVGRGLGF